MTGHQRRLAVIASFMATLLATVLFFASPTQNASSAMILAAVATSVPPSPDGTPTTALVPAASSTTSPRGLESTVAPAHSRWTLVFGGDTLLTRPIRSSARTPFARVLPALDTGDLAIVNLETALTERGTKQAKTYTFRSPPEFSEVLKDSGVDVVSLANNHTLDFGTVGLLDTLENLDAAGVGRVGAGRTITEALTPFVVERGGVRVAILGASQIIPAATWVAQSTRPGIASAGKHILDVNTERVLVAVRESRKRADVVVVVMHWGIEGDPCPSAVQRRLAKELHAAGASIVLGAHPHVLQPIEFSGTELTAFSLGNFIWDPRSGATADTGTLEVTFVGPAPVSYRFHPHRLDGNGWAASIDATTPTGRRIEARASRRCR